jgi:hypothetical protein
MPGEKELVKAKAPKDKSTSKETPKTEASNEDLAAEITKPSQPVSNDKEQTDSIRVDRSAGIKTPAAMEKRSAVPDSKRIEASTCRITGNRQIILMAI